MQKYTGQYKTSFQKRFVVIESVTHVKMCVCHKDGSTFMQTKKRGREKKRILNEAVEKVEKLLLFLHVQTYTCDIHTG